MSSSRSTEDLEWDVPGGYGDDPRPARARRTERRPALWRAPFSAYYYREVGFALSGLPLAIAGFATSVIMFCFGLGTFITALGLPVLGALTSTARGFGRLERARVRGLLALDVPGPEPVRQVRPGTWGGVTARLADAAGWKAVLYQVVMFPWALFSFVVTLTFLVLGWVMALYPVYHWVFPTYTSWNGYRVFDFTDDEGIRHVYEVQAPWQIAGLSVLGLLLVLLTTQLVRGLTNVNRAAAQGLLGR